METAPAKPRSASAKKKGMPWQLTVIYILLALHLILCLFFLFALKLPGQYTSGFTSAMFPTFYIINVLFDLLCIILLFMRYPRAITIAKAYIVVILTISFALTILLIWQMNNVYVVKVTDNKDNLLTFIVYMGISKGGTPITEEGTMDLGKFPEMQNKQIDDNFKVYLDVTKDNKGKTTHEYSPMDYEPYRNIIFLHGLAIILLVVAVVFINTNVIYNYIFARELVKAPEL
jgi:hypothetical protein